MEYQDIIGLVLFVIALGGVGYFIYKKRPWE